MGSDDYGTKNNFKTKWIGIILIFIMVILGLMIFVPILEMMIGPEKSKCTGQVCITKFIKGPPSFDDIKMSEYLWKNHFNEPDNSGEYNLSGNTGLGPALNDTLEFILHHYKNKTKGTFVVLGAGDGEYRDLTLSLERNQNWSGLLVEPNPYLYKILKSKGRKATLSNLCVSPYYYSIEAKFGYPSILEGESHENKMTKWRKSKLMEVQTKAEIRSATIFKQQCVPLENLLFAAGITKQIDLLVLDMSATDVVMLSRTNLDNIAKIKDIIAISHGEDMKEDYKELFFNINLTITYLMGIVNGYHVYIMLAGS